MSEDNSSVLLRIRAAYPGVQVTRTEAGWRAVLPGTAGERVITSSGTLGDLETAIEREAGRGTRH